MATILIVDDNKNNLQVLGNILNESKYRVAMAIDGKTALRLVAKTNPDLIILDIMMPEMDGFEVCRILKSDTETAEIPIVFLSAKTDLEDVVKGFQLGGVDYLTKPFKKEELLLRVRNHIKLVEDKKILEKKYKELRAGNSFKDELLKVFATNVDRRMSGLIETCEFPEDHQTNFTIEDYGLMLKGLKNKAEETKSLVENVIWWTRSQQELLHPKMQPLILSDHIQGVLDFFNPQILQKDINIENKVDSTVEIVCDGEFLNVILKNVLSNALKFSNKGSIITLSVEEKDEKTCFSVQDEGVGMSPEVLQDVMGKYSYHSDDGTNVEKGHGVGIKLIMELLPKIGADIEITSEENKGTTVCLFFQAVN